MTLFAHLSFIFVAWLAASLALIAEHIALKHQPWRIEPPYTYVVGLGTVLLACGVWALLDRAPIALEIAVLGFGLVSTSGGWVIVLYYWDDRSARGRQAAQRQGEIVGAALGLTQDLIDAGGRHAADNPRRHN